MARVKINKDSTDGVNSITYKNVDFSKIKLTGGRTLDDPVFIPREKGSLIRNHNKYGSKEYVLKVIRDGNIKEIIEVSKYFYKVSGIYNRLLRYMANLYKYDWFVVPYINSDSSIKDTKTEKDFYSVLSYIEESKVKQFFEEAALKVLKHGCYYGYINDLNDRATVQELPLKYCRSRFGSKEGRAVVEFNMKFFDDMFSDTNERLRMLEVFPEEFYEGYAKYKLGLLPPDFPGDISGWYMLDTNKAFKFNIHGDDFPLFIATIPAILDLDMAQDLDRKKMEQQLLKLIIQTMPIDKNGDLVFDIDEAQALHNNVVNMLNDAIGVDVLTTFADVKVEGLMDDDATTNKDQLEKVERSVFNQSGTPQMLFNTDGNLALDKSILNDETVMLNLIRKFEDFLNMIIKKFNKSNKTTFKVQILNTTIYNYKELADTYKAQTQLGYSKILPAVALGQTQSSVLASVKFENEILDLPSKFIPPMSSNTMSAQTAEAIRSGNIGNKNLDDSEKKPGRPSNESQGKSVSEKTIQNRESES